jgi:hypothetical protein
VVLLPPPLSAGIIPLATMPSFISLFNSVTSSLNFKTLDKCSKYLKSIILPLEIFTCQRNKKTELLYLKHSVRQQYSNINLSHLWTAIQSSYSYDKLKQAEASWLYD